MKGLRLALVTHRYWPLGSDGEHAMATLAGEFIRQGHAAQVVTASYDPSWPTEIVVRDVPVVRLAYPRMRWWGTLRFMHLLLRWLEEAASRLDGVIVSGLRYEAWCAGRALPRGRSKVLLRAEQGGERGDCAWQESLFLGSRIREACRRCTGIVAPTAEIEDELRRSYANVPIRQIANGIEPWSQASSEERQAARNALREVNHDLTLDDRAPLVVFLGRFESWLGVQDLVFAWREIAARWPFARLWLIGDGPLRDSLWQQISDLDLRYRICMPGTFEDFEDVLRAADVVVAPTRTGGPTMQLLLALAAGVPLVVTATESNLQVVGNAALVVPPRQPAEISQAIAQLLENRTLASALAAAGRERVAANFGVAAMACQHLEMLNV